MTYEGTLRRQADGTFAGALRNQAGFTIPLTATVREDAAGKFFAISGMLGATPAPLVLDGEDEWRNPA